MQDSRAERLYVLLRSAIEAGDYPARSALPNQAALAKQLGTSVATLRKALDRLAHEGFVEARHGAGTYVRSAQPVRGRVLVADDDPSARQMLSDILHELGFEVDTVDSGEQAVARAAQRRYTHVLLDVRMGGIGGLSAAARIRQIDPEVVIVFLTGHPSDVVESQAPGVWPALLLRKPFEIEELERTLNIRVG